jgi:hypothetical protein
MDAMSTKMAADVLATETRAFGNASAKLSLQTATDAFLRAKEALQQRSAANGKVTQEEK